MYALQRYVLILYDIYGVCVVLSGETPALRAHINAVIKTQVYYISDIELLDFTIHKNICLSRKIVI